MAHYPFVFDEKGNYNPKIRTNLNKYRGHHAFSAKRLLKYIDIILENDPDAVIMLQGDHGLHKVEMERIMDAFFCTSEEAEALWNQVMSAVRLPEELMTSETEQILSDPRNISRYLINHFVGQNYEYIPAQYVQTYEGPSPKNK